MQAEFLQHLNSFPDEQWEKRLVYGGEQAQTRGTVNILPWSQLADAGVLRPTQS